VAVQYTKVQYSTAQHSTAQYRTERLHGEGGWGDSDALPVEGPEESAPRHGPLGRSQTLPRGGNGRESCSRAESTGARVGGGSLTAGAEVAAEVAPPRGWLPGQAV